MSDQPKNPLKIILERESSYLDSCPFCGGKANFTADNSGHLIIEHLPAAGVCCPARYHQVCDTFEQGRKWWNTRCQFDESEHPNPEINNE